MRLLICLLLLEFSGYAIASSEEASVTGLPTSYQRENKPWLTHTEARLRAQTLADVAYHLQIDLSEEKQYHGTVTIKFNYQPSEHPLTLDFLDGTILSVSRNSLEIPFEYNGHHISIPPGSFKQGRNEISIRYLHSYSKTGAGLYRYVDSTDQRVYLYTMFEPYDANRMVPSFDQPNLRATWSLSVTVPNGWVVVSSNREQRIEVGESDSVWHFPASKPISSYILPLHAGQYHQWQGMAGNVPLRLFARESLAKSVNADWYLDVTARGMAFFEQYFDEPYPFAKYDQLIVPDFNIGGMENVGAVTYTEGYVPRGEPTRDRLQGIANTFLHELAHMWFGDLVTIDWWNALWLKESFASVMAPLALPSAGYEDAWLSFYLEDKQGAYQADEQVTTHPIEMLVPDTLSGDASFDAITYNKGASVLKQLAYYLGEETFRDGVREYINRFAWQAATLPDFMGTLAETSGRDLQTWTEHWLETAGVNTIKADYDCDKDKVTRFDLLQGAPRANPVLRSHRLQVGLYVRDEDELTSNRMTSIEMNGPVTHVPEFIGAPCPLLVYPNVGDWGYIRVLLDEKSFAAAPSQLEFIKEPLLRSMFWQSLWDAVREQDAALTDYLDIALKQMPAEENVAVLPTLTRHLFSARKYLYLFGDNAVELRAQYLPDLESMVWQQVMASKTGTDRQKIWFDAWVVLADSAEAIKRLELWLGGESQPLGLNEDQDRRWTVLTKLASRGYKNTAKLLASEQQRDPSDRGKMMAITVNAAQPLEAVKDSNLKTIEDIDGGQSSAQLKQALYGLFPAGQEALHQQFSARILSGLPEMDKSRDPSLMEVFNRSALPVLCTTESVQQLHDAIVKRGSMSLGSTKALRVAHQEDQRCVDMLYRQVGQPTVQSD